MPGSLRACALEECVWAARLLVEGCVRLSWACWAVFALTQPVLHLAICMGLSHSKQICRRTGK